MFLTSKNLAKSMRRDSEADEVVVFLVAAELFSSSFMSYCNILVPDRTFCYTATEEINLNF